MKRLLEWPDAANIDADLLDFTHTERVEHLLAVIAATLRRKATWEVCPWMGNPAAAFDRSGG